MAWAALTPREPLPINGVNDIDEALVIRVNNLEDSLLDLELELSDMEERLDDVDDRLDLLNATFREELGLTNAEVRLVLLRNKIVTLDDIEGLSGDVLDMRSELFQAFDVSPPNIPPNFEDVDMVFGNLERVINQGDEVEALHLIDVILNRLRTNVDLTVVEACEVAGGEWTEFPNACVDNCYAPDICAQVLTDGCDCGPGMCWNGLECQEQ